MVRELTSGRGPDAVSDAVGFGAHGDGLLSKYHEVKQAVKLESDRPITLTEAIMSVRNGGHVSIIGDYIGFGDKIPLGSLMNRILTVKTGQCPVQSYLQPLSEKIQQGEIDPSFENKDVLIAWNQDGQPLTGDNGPVRLVVPGDGAGGRYVNGVVTMEVRDVDSPPRPNQALDWRCRLCS